MPRGTSTNQGKRGRRGGADPQLARLSRAANRNLAATARLADTLARQGLPPLSTRQLQAFLEHELRAPLTAAILQAGLARRQIAAGELAPSAAALEVAEAEMRRLDSLISRIAELARQGHLVIHPSRCDLSQAVHAAVRRALVVLPSVSDMLTVTTDGPLVGWWDAVAVEQIVQNLVFNAEKFSGGRSIEVVVRRVAGGAQICVCDDGRGLVPAESALIFHAGYRSVRARREGDGLGLWLVKCLAEAHGGQVAVDGRPGKGAVFTVTLREMERALARKDDGRVRAKRSAPPPPPRERRNDDTPRVFR